MNSALNAISPYYTMFPLEFPLRALERRRRCGRAPEWVLDPFCGRGTTNFAARCFGIPSVGVDANPVAVAIARAKLATTTASRVVSLARRLLSSAVDPEIPGADFWKWAYDQSTLSDLCRLRLALIKRCDTDDRIVLRAILLGALHGPRSAATSYLSNQCPRTFAPKPRYAVKFWRERELHPPKVNVLTVVAKRAERFLQSLPAPAFGSVILGDSRDANLFPGPARHALVLTSPPYYGMRTYLPDQWLRNWFIGGLAAVPYKASLLDVTHRSRSLFTSQLQAVWRNCARVCAPSSTLIVRFGSIHDRCVNAVELLKTSLRETGWTLTTVRSAGNAADGRRQATQFKRSHATPRDEYDFYAVREGRLTSAR